MHNKILKFCQIPISWMIMQHEVSWGGGGARWSLCPPQDLVQMAPLSQGGSSAGLSVFLGVLHLLSQPTFLIR